MKLAFFIILTFFFVLAKEVKMEMGLNKIIYQQCKDCHRAKNLTQIPEKYQPRRAHENIKLAHGNKEMSCNHCHDKNQHNFLVDIEQNIVSFRQPSPVCFQCHSDVYKSWLSNIHGKQTGNWKGEKVKHHCTTCHNAHKVRFSEMKAQSPPRKPKFLIPKNH